MSTTLQVLLLLTIGSSIKERPLPLNLQFSILATQIFLYIMKVTAFVATLLVAVVSARDFTVYEHSEFRGETHPEGREDADTCCTPIFAAYKQTVGYR